jgi:hypothetical protein
MGKQAPMSEMFYFGSGVTSTDPYGVLLSTPAAVGMVMLMAMICAWLAVWELALVWTQSNPGPRRQ